MASWQSPLTARRFPWETPASSFGISDGGARWRPYELDHLAKAEELIQTQQAEDAPLAGKILFGLGAASVVRIPVPGTNGLAIEFSARGWVPKTGSTSSIFVQDLTGKRHLRLDYGFNKNSKLFEWHWNQKGVAETFGITNHTSVGPVEQALGNTAKYYKYVGRTFLVLGAAADIYSIVTSSTPLRRTVQVAAGWAGAAAGCKVAGAGGAAGGLFFSPVGSIVGGVVGCAIGGFLGYMTAEAVAGYIYDWVQGTIFRELEPSSGTFQPAGGSSGGGGASGDW